MKHNKILLSLFALFAGAAAFAQENTGDSGTDATAVEITAVRIDENVVLTDTEVNITDTGKSFWAWDQTSGAFEYAAVNGTLNIAGDAEVGNTWSTFTDQTLSVNFLGSGNSINFASGKSINLSAVGGSEADGSLVNTGNTFTSTVASSDAEAPNTLSVDTIRIAGGVNYGGDEGSTSLSSMVFAGNTVLKSTTNTVTPPDDDPEQVVADRYYTDIYLNNTDVNGGVSKLVVKNSNNVLNIDDLSVNSAWIDTSDPDVVSRYKNLPKAVVDFGGKGNTINIRWLSVNSFGVDASSVVKIAAGNDVTVGYEYGTYSRIEANMVSGLNFREVYNAETGELSNGTLFAFEGASNEGLVDVSTISIDSWNGASINAFILLDITDSFAELSADFAQSAILFENLGSDPWGEDSEFYIQIGSHIIGEGESWGNFSFDSVDISDGKLVFNFTVPEPSTCAAIFGALALALALYRRRK